MLLTSSRTRYALWATPWSRPCPWAPTSAPTPKAEEARDKLIDASFASADVPTFNLWETAVDNLNKQTVRGNERLDESKLIARYIKGVKKFGKAIAKDLKDDICPLKGDSNAFLTRKIIRTILGVLVGSRTFPKRGCSIAYGMQ